MDIREKIGSVAEQIGIGSLVIGGFSIFLIEKIITETEEIIKDTDHQEKVVEKNIQQTQTEGEPPTQQTMDYDIDRICLN